MRFGEASGGRRARSGRAAISLTPLIDVVFILLVFFMLASSFADWQAFNLGTTRTTTAVPKSDETAVRIEVAADGTLTVNGATVDDTGLGQRLAAAAAQDPAQRVVIRPAPGVPLQRVVTVIDAAKAAGLDNFTLVKPRGT